MTLDARTFRDPQGLPRGVTLWMLNDRLDAREMTRQLEGFAEAGWGAAITRTYNGLMTEYLSEEYMDLLECACRQAERVGIELWFQAGYMPGHIPDLPPEHEVAVLTVLGVDEPAEDGDERLARDERYVYVRRRRSCQLNVLNADAVGAYLDDAYERTWTPRFSRWLGGVIGAIWVDEPKLPTATPPYDDRIAEAFADDWGYDLAEHIRELFVDLPGSFRVRHHYRRTLQRLMIEGYFRPVRDWCDAHGVRFTGHLMGEDNLPSQIAFTCSTGPEYRYFHVPGIDHLTRSLRWAHGQVAGEAARGEGPTFILTPRQCASAANQFGQSDVLAEMYGVSTQGLTHADRKRIGDYFAVLGINTRCLHGSFYSVRGRRKRIYPPTLSCHQPWWPDARMLGDYFGRLGWAMRQGGFRADALVVHNVESAYGRFVPQEYARHRPEGLNEAIGALNTSLLDVSKNLLRAHRGFDYGEEPVLAELGRVEGGRLIVGEMSYPAVVLPRIETLRESTLDLLERFLEAGGTVLAIDDAPAGQAGADGPAGLSDERASRVAALLGRATRVENTPASLDDALEQAVPAEVRVEGDGAENVWVHHRRTADGEDIVLAAYVLEQGRFSGSLALRGAASLQQWDALTGEVRDLPAQKRDGWATLELTLRPDESILLVCGPGQAKASTPDAPGGRRSSSPTARESVLAELAGPWSVARRDPNALVLDFARLKREASEFTDPLPVLGIQQLLTEDEPYRGPITLRYECEVVDVPSRAALAVEHPHLGEILVNGRAVGEPDGPMFVDRCMPTIDVTGLLRAGPNTIDLCGEFTPLQRAQGLGGLFSVLQGCELEPVYLVGEFVVRANESADEARGGCIRLAPGPVVANEAGTTDGDLIRSGYPFFAGTIALSRTFTLDVEPAGACEIDLGAPATCTAKVRVNGTDAGTVGFSPWRVDATGLLRAGENVVEIELTNTLRNLHGPNHRPSGEPDDVWGDNAFSGRYDRQSDTGYERWYQRRQAETLAWTDDYHVVPLGLPGPVRIVQSNT
jgi:hypothetical protein